MEVDKVRLKQHIDKVDMLYPNMSDDEIVKRLAYWEFHNGVKTLTITDKIITEEILKLSDEINSITSEYSKIDVLFKLIVGDYNDLLITREKIYKNEKVESGKLTDNLNRYFMHFLASSRLFTEFMENYFIKKYGKEADEYIKFKKILSSVYDSCFEYRLFYSLRNFSQHIGLPITDIEFKLINPKDYNDNSANLNAKISIEYLLESSFNWKKLRGELVCLQSNEEYIDIYSLCEKFFESIIFIKNKMKELFLINNNHLMQSLANRSMNIGLETKLYVISKIQKYNLKYNPSNYTIHPLSTKVNIDYIYIDLLNMGLVNLIDLSFK